MPDYSNGKIYKITSPNCEDVYVGSTIQCLNQRFSGHKSKRNCSSKKIIESGQSVIELIEEFICETRTELLRREGEIQKSTLNCCNNNIAGRTNQEWREDNADIIKANYKANANTISITNAEYYKANADTILQQRIEYKKLNADKIKKYQAEYRQKKKSALII